MAKRRSYVTVGSSGSYPRANWWKQTLETDFVSGGSEALLLSEDFTGTSVDTSKGTITNPDSANLSVTQNNKLIFTRVTDNAVASPLANKWETVAAYPRGSVFAVTMNRDNGFTNSLHAIRWFFNSNIEFISIQNSATAPGTIRVYIQHETASFYDFETGISTSNRVKIIYNSDNAVSFWYWNITQWTQMGTTQTVDLGAEGKVILMSNSAAADVAGDIFSYDTVRITNYDYVTQLPD